MQKKTAAPKPVLLLLLHRKSRCGISALKKEVLFVYINMLEMHTIIIINKNCLPTHGWHLWDTCGIVSDWMFDFTRKPISNTKQVSWLTDRYTDSPSHIYVWVMQWDHWAVFPVYSDRIVQDSHLVPSSDSNCGIVLPALDTAILNYTNNIINLKREVVNPPFF